MLSYAVLCFACLILREVSPPQLPGLLIIMQHMHQVPADRNYRRHTTNNTPGITV